MRALESAAASVVESLPVDPRFDRRQLLTVLLVFALCGFLAAVYLVQPEQLRAWLGLGEEAAARMHGWLKVFSTNMPLELGKDGHDTAAPKVLAIFGGLFLGFVGSYLAPARWKLVPQLLVFVGLVIGIFGGAVFLELTYCLLAYYLLSHYDARDANKARLASFAIIALFAAFYSHVPAAAGISRLWWWGGTALSQLAFLWGLPFAFARLPHAWRLRMPLVAYFVAIGLIHYLHYGRPALEALTPGFGLFLLYGIRLMFHFLDLRDRQLPLDLPLKSYFANFYLLPDFLSPNWWQYTGQGYAYRKKVFYARDINQIVRKGVGLILLGFHHVVIFPPLFKALMGTTGLLGTQIIHIQDFQAEFSAGSFPVLKLLLTSLYVFATYVTIFWGGLHIKVGLYNLFGFDVQPYTNFPIVATSLPEFFKRFGYHYMQLILRMFYLPAFLKLKSWGPRGRMLGAALFAIGIGQFLTIYPRKVLMADTNPFLILYFTFFLGFASFVSFVFTQQSDRKPWTADRYLPLDVFRVYLNFQVFAFIELFQYYKFMGRFWVD